MKIHVYATDIIIYRSNFTLYILILIFLFFRRQYPPYLLAGSKFSTHGSPSTV